MQHLNRIEELALQHRVRDGDARDRDERIKKQEKRLNETVESLREANITVRTLERQLKVAKSQSSDLPEALAVAEIAAVEAKGRADDADRRAGDLSEALDAGQGLIASVLIGGAGVEANDEQGAEFAATECVADGFGAVGFVEIVEDICWGCGHRTMFFDYGHQQY